MADLLSAAIASARTNRSEQLATIQKRGDLQWRVQIRKKGFKPIHRTFQSKQQAVAWANDVESKMSRGFYIDTSESEKTTVAEIIDRFTHEFAPHHYRRRKDRSEAWRFQCARLKEKLGRYYLSALDQKLVADYRDERLKQVSEATVRKEVYMLSKIWGFAEMEAGIELPRGNPVKKIRKPSEGRPRDRRLTKDEWDRFESQCRRSRNRLLWPAAELAVETAMRQGEILSLRWEDVNIEDEVALLWETKNGEARTVPLTTRAKEILNSLPGRKSGRVIQLERQTLYHAFAAAVKRAHIKDFTFHDLRHEGISRLAERGDLSLLELSKFSGHKTLQMLKRYTHLDAKELAKKINSRPPKPNELGSQA